MKSFVIGPNGGSVSFVDQSTGEAREIPLTQGVYPLSRFAPFRQAGERIGVPGPRIDGQNFIESRGNFQTVKPVGQFESAANPSFRVSPAQRQIADIKRMMARTEALHKRTLKAARAIERAKAAPPPAQLAAPTSEASSPPSDAS